MNPMSLKCKFAVKREAFREKRKQVLSDVEPVLVVDNAFVLQLFEELADVGANFSGIGIAELGL
jgi:hypothetical protein